MAPEPRTLWIVIRTTWPLAVMLGTREGSVQVAAAPVFAIVPPAGANSAVRLCVPSSA